MAERLLLVRHGEVEAAGQGRFIGRTDLGLSGAGRGQALALAGVLTGLGALQACASPLRRARETAALALGSAHALTLDEDLREVDFGDWEGKRFAEIAAADPARVRDWAALPDGFAFPGGEAFAAFRARVVAGMARLTAGPAGTVVAFTHGGVIRLMVCHVLGLDPRHFLRFDVEPASLTEFRREGEEWGLALLNGRHHLGG